MIKNTFWKNYWSDKTHGQHRSQTEDFLKNEAKEKLFHLDGGKSILDLGCGSADLLAYYARAYELCIGADWSESMINKAYERLKSFDVQDNVHLLQADDTQIWEHVKQKFGNEFKFDRITAGQVIQYLSEEQIDHFIHEAKSHLAPEGKICLFDVVDSRTYELWRAGLFNHERIHISTINGLLIGRLRTFKNKLTGKPLYDLGYIYSPAQFKGFAEKYDLIVSFVHSMYYEYRYHVTFQKKSK